MQPMDDTGPCPQEKDAHRTYQAPHKAVPHVAVGVLWRGRPLCLQHTHTQQDLVQDVCHGMERLCQHGTAATDEVYPHLGEADDDVDTDGNIEGMQLSVHLFALLLCNPHPAVPLLAVAAAALPSAGVARNPTTICTLTSLTGHQLLEGVSMASRHCSVERVGTVSIELASELMASSPMVVVVVMLGALCQGRWEERFAPASQQFVRLKGNAAAIHIAVLACWAKLK
mmetsp:Transcript_22780/g.62960  ORF Transcript_22780/g.62960 Transcript_22780/m.62960 type:complete len:227 (+) Transcript_22780:2213-2893(+)